MRPMNIDFIGSTPLPRLGWALLLAGLTLSGIAVGQGLRYRQQQVAWSHAQDAGVKQLAESERQRLAALPPILPLYEDDKRWQRAAAELALPWIDTLRAIEQATKPPVYLLGFKPDPISGRLQLDAEAPDLGGALAYVHALQTESQFSGTQLLSHEQTTDPLGRTQLRISLQTQWVGQR
jgi:hypothetical protein